MSRRSCTVAVLGGILAGLVAGCSSPTDAESEVPDLWRTQIDQLLAGEGMPISDVHREILADNAISEAEYGELRQLLSDCLAAHEIEHELTPQEAGASVRPISQATATGLARWS